MALPPKRTDFWSPAKRELWVEVHGLADWFGAPHIAAGLGADYVFLLNRARTRRFSIYGIAPLFGSWGDNRHGGFSLEAGTRVRASFYTSTMWDFYSVAKVGGRLGVLDGLDGALRLGPGLGVRALRSVSFEITADWVFGLDRRFREGTSERRAYNGVGLSVGFDTCLVSSWCEKPARKPELEDATCTLYAKARGVCQSRPAGDKQLCAAVHDALDASTYPPASYDRGAEAFLVALQKELGGAVPSAEIAALLDEHLELSQGRRCMMRRAREAKQCRQELAVRREYAPYPIEIARALGCLPRIPKSDGTKPPPPPEEPCPNVCGD